MIAVLAGDELTGNLRFFSRPVAPACFLRKSRAENDAAYILYPVTRYIQFSMTTG